MSEGEPLGEEVECAHHYTRFDLRTGAVVSLPAIERTLVLSCPVSVEDVQVFVVVRDSSNCGAPHRAMDGA